MAVLILAAALGCAEATLRYRASRRARKQQGVLRLNYYPHRRQGYALVRGVEYFGRVHINQYGLRGPEFSARKLPGTTRIMVMGASAAFDGCAATDSVSWPARLQHWLNASATGGVRGGRRYEVINAAVPGYSMLDNIIRLESELYAFEPDIIVLYAGHGTVGRGNALAHGDANGDATPDALPTATPWGTWLSTHSLLYKAGAARMNAWMTPGDDGELREVDESQWNQAVSHVASEFHRDLVTFVQVAKGLGARVVVVELANVNGATPAEALSKADADVLLHAFGAPPGVTLEAFRQFNAIQRSVADSLGETFLSAKEFGITGRAKFCADDPIHVNAAGAEVLGSKLAASLLAANARTR